METAKNSSGHVRDDGLFTTLLSSAYSLQLHQDRIRSKMPAAKFGEIMGEVINTQVLIRTRHLDPDTAMHLVVNRTQKLVAAAGAAIALLDGENLEYKVGTGSGAMLLGLRIRANSSTSFTQLRKEPLVETHAWEDTALKRLIATRILSVPIYQGGTLAGCLQLFSRTGHFDPHGVYACELMSAIVSHSIADQFPRPERTLVRAITAEKNKGDRLERPTVPPPNGHCHKGQPIQDALDEARRKIEAQLKKVANPKAADKAPGPAPDVDLRKESTGRLEGKDTRSGSRLDDLEGVPPLDDLIREIQETEGFAEEAAQPRKLVGSVIRWPIPAPSNGRKNTANLSGAEVNDSPETEASEGSEISSSTIPASRAEHGSSHASHVIDGKREAEVAEKSVWGRLKPVCYPVFVLIFAVIVRVAAGTQSWALEILIYALLVFTTIEIHQRLSKR